MDASKRSKTPGTASDAAMRRSRLVHDVVVPTPHEHDEAGLDAAHASGHRHLPPPPKEQVPHVAPRFAGRTGRRERPS